MRTSTFFVIMLSLGASSVAVAAKPVVEKVTVKAMFKLYNTLDKEVVYKETSLVKVQKLQGVAARCNDVKHWIDAEFHDYADSKVRELDTYQMKENDIDRIKLRTADVMTVSYDDELGRTWMCPTPDVHASAVVSKKLGFGVVEHGPTFIRK